MNKKFFYKLIVFWVINFAALAIGSVFTRSGVASEWYANLMKAPWEPPGWVFGAAWTTIMVCFGVYMAYLWTLNANRKILLGIFAIQWILNVGWNPVFFFFHHIFAGFIVITVLTIVVALFLVKYWNIMKLKSGFILPYLIWLLIATSLNGYILFYNQ